jgi:hypothetical protein
MSKTAFFVFVPYDSGFACGCQEIEGLQALALDIHPFLVAVHRQSKHPSVKQIL